MMPEPKVFFWEAGAGSATAISSAMFHHAKHVIPRMWNLWNWAPKGPCIATPSSEPPPPGWKGAVPYLLGQVELPQGPHVVSQIVECPLDGVRIGMMLHLHLGEVEPSDDGKVMVVFKWCPVSWKAVNVGEL